MVEMDHDSHDGDDGVLWWHGVKAYLMMNGVGYDKMISDVVVGVEEVSYYPTRTVVDHRSSIVVAGTRAARRNDADASPCNIARRKNDRA